MMLNTDIEGITFLKMLGLPTENCCKATIVIEPQELVKAYLTYEVGVNMTSHKFVHQVKQFDVVLKRTIEGENHMKS